jgi:Mn2+/Fe2+ NRAMP family transporter
LNYERADTVIGSIVVVAVATLLISVTAAGLAPHGGTGAYTDALAVARGLQRYVNSLAGSLFAILLLNASVIGAAAVTLASSYAIGDLSPRLNQGLNTAYVRPRPSTASSARCW